MATETFRGARKKLISATDNVKTSRGRIAKILVAAGTGSIDVYDDPAANNNKVWSKAASAVGDVYDLDVPMDNGIRVVMGAAGNLTVTYD
ncbi:MAG TPA: hypothetical protein VFC53_01510 [Dehalococcoidia bacterium]|jgi:hypothetical protein|nr:hypothetical protein [Dehalococcoidia bacterium]